MSSKTSSPAIDAGAMILRMRRALGCPRDADLAAALGLSVSAVSKWRQRNSVPLEAVLAVAERCGLTSDYLIHGDLSAAGRLAPGEGAIARALGQAARRPMLVRGGVLAVAMERAAQEWASANQGRDLTVFELGERASRLYGDYLLSVASEPELEGEILEAMATVLRPHLHWRLSGTKGGNRE